MDVDGYYYYHYTNRKGLDGIRSSKYIKPSTRQGDMMLGQGVYITDLSPNNSKEMILKNNYGSLSYRDRVTYFTNIYKSIIRFLTI